MKQAYLWALLAASLSANAVVAGIALRRASASPTAAAPPLFAKVALDGEQKTHILALRERLLAERREQGTQLAELRGALAQQLVHDPQDTQSLEAVLGRIETAQRGFQRRIVAHVLAVRAILRPDQRPAFEQLVTAQMRAGMPFDPSRERAGEGASR
ncbi:MAG: periplasmic heavy metal sensor [Myxococcales bacterium]